MDKKKYSGKFVVRISPQDHKTLAAYSFDTGKSLNSIVKSAIEKEVKKISAKSLAV